MKTLLNQKDSNFEQEKRNIMALLDQEKSMQVNLQEQFATLLAQEKQIHGNLQKQFVTLLADTNKKGDNQVVPDSLPATVAPSAVENEKPSVLLVGTSNIAKINETKITNAAKVSKIVKYTIDDTKDIINEYEDFPDVVVFHPLTNDIKTRAKDECVSLMKDLTDQVEEKWPDSKIIISPRLRNNVSMDKIYKDIEPDKLNTKFCKLVLGVNRKSSNFAVFAELGRHPFYLDIVKNVLIFGTGLRICLRTPCYTMP